MAHICLRSLVTTLCLIISLSTSKGLESLHSFCDSNTKDCGADRQLTVITVATDDNDLLRRFLRSATIYNYNVEVLGQGETWRGGDVTLHPGGGQKLNLLKSALKNRKSDDNLILFVDSYDVLLTNTKTALLEEYLKLGGGTIFGAESACWPDKNLQEKYPKVEEGENRFLNSGGFIGPASTVYKMLSTEVIQDKDDDQRFFTKIFLNEKLRTQFNMKLDTKSRLFLNLNGALDKVDLVFNENTGYLQHKETKIRPVVIHGNGPIKATFNGLSNYLVHSWTPTKGCQQCTEGRIELGADADYPVVQLSVFVDYPTPFLEVFFSRIAALTYPKSKVHFTGYISELAVHQGHLAEAFNKTYGGLYRTITWFKHEDISDPRTRAFAYCLAIENCKFIFSVDGVAQLTNPEVLGHLVSMNRSVLSPLLSRRGKLWSNFWGAIGSQDEYQRSTDYVDIVEGKKQGVWIVPFIQDAYLLSRRVARILVGKQANVFDWIHMDISRAITGVNDFLMVDNQHYYGYLTDPSKYPTEHLHNDLYEIFDNPLDWEEQYIHPEFLKISAPEFKMEDVNQPCPDVFWFPMLTKKFCKQLIDEMENFGNWSDGKNNDSRLEGGYENVPTRDIHMNQVGWEPHWIHVLRTYVYKMQTKLFEGYSDIPGARMNFVVRYKPDEQPSLRPHHDSSSYSLNIALNEKHVEFEGGGTRYVRYNCSISETNVGWVVMSPGRVTHLHEGLTTTWGTRYIFVTFVNP